VLAESSLSPHKSEEGTMFKEAKKTDIDFDVLEARWHLKQRLQQGVPEPGEMIAAACEAIVRKNANNFMFR
jgi:hypothetical protein